jgi:hypothetical protein
MTTHLCMLLDRFSRELHSANYSCGISTKLPQAYNTQSRGLRPRIWYTKFRRLHHEFDTLHPGGSLHSFGVPSSGGHNGCIPRRQSQARSSGNSTMGTSTLSTHASYHGFRTLSTRVQYNGSVRLYMCLGCVQALWALGRGWLALYSRRPLGFLCRGQGFLPLPIYVCVLCNLIINLLFFPNISSYMVSRD